jgi:hypothetical protein
MDPDTPMISAPASASPIAIPLPMPLLQPVTRAVLPERSKRFTESCGELLIKKIIVAIVQPKQQSINFFYDNDAGNKN